MNERYDIHGNAYWVKATLDDGTVIGSVLYEDPDSGEAGISRDGIVGDLQVIDCELFDSPPRQWLRRKRRAGQRKSRRWKRS